MKVAAWSGMCTAASSSKPVKIRIIPARGSCPLPMSKGDIQRLAPPPQPGLSPCSSHFQTFYFTSGHNTDAPYTFALWLQLTVGGQQRRLEEGSGVLLLPILKAERHKDV
ncbi:Polyprotein p69 [Frankliniella fusca]|uniref:Polyprotein p69 n=1 Tax=Frankliniella fusca TaxID=407009 RepID=A0AAE1H0H9_9NEOP|nr:Polyprotein p69 [Frankliniella fusca]